MTCDCVVALHVSQVMRDSCSCISTRAVPSVNRDALAAWVHVDPTAIFHSDLCCHRERRYTYRIYIYTDSSRSLVSCMTLPSGTSLRAMQPTPTCIYILTACVLSNCRRGRCSLKLVSWACFRFPVGRDATASTAGELAANHVATFVNFRPRIATASIASCLI